MFITDMFHLLIDQFQLVQNNKPVQGHEAKDLVILHHLVRPHYQVSVDE
jgi:hypothetical protein